MKQLAIVSAILFVLIAPAIAGSDEIYAQSCPAASRLDVGMQYYAYLSAAGEIDWMKWDSPDAGKFAVTLEVPSGRDYDLEVYTVCNKPACTSSNGAGKTEKCTINNPGPGNVYAKIYGYNGDYSKTAKYYITGSVEKPVVDLEATSIKLNPAAPTDKDSIDFTYTFVNLGPDDISESFDNKFYIDGTEKNTYRASGLKKASWISYTVSGIKLTAGSHTLKQHTDSGNEIKESNENNNIYTQDISVAHLDDYKLELSDYYTIPKEVDDKHPFDIVWFVTNTGSDDITASFRTDVSFKSLVDYSLIQKSCTFSGLKAGASKECRLETQRWVAGIYSGSVMVDSDHQVSDYRDGTDWVIIVKHIPDVDLSVSSIYTEPSSVNEKTAFTLKYDVKNSGSEVADKPFKSQLYINGVLKGTCDHVSGLGSGQVQSCGVSNQKWQTGSYSVRAVADTDDAVTEVNEGNNELIQAITVADSCQIRDGSSAECECNSNADCPLGYYCEFRTGPDACAKATCNNECSSSGFFCSEGDAYECGNFDSDPCTDRRIVDACGVGEVCREGERSCQIDPTPVEIHVEDASTGTAVYKQPDDLIEVTLNSEKLQSIIFSYPENFTLISGNCANGAISVAGAKACLFRISDTIAEGNYYFSAKGKVAKVTITESPNTIIITNKQKLRERFSNDISGVDSLLKQAFQLANSQGNTVVYYLDRELQDHPFAFFGSYSESILSPSLSSNPYGMSVAEFINKKCGQCRNTIILGDDYVVPFYRVDYSTIHSFFGFWIGNNTETSSIYSDQPYIKENRKTVGDISSLFDRSEHKEVKIVIPDAPSAELQERVEQLKEVLRSEFGYDDSDVNVINSGKVGCNSYGTLDKSTLILIGSRDDNNAIKCVPWFDVGRKPTDTFKASIEVERNVWANNEYAIIVSGPDIESGIDNLVTLLKHYDYFEGTMLGSKNSVFVHDFSNPPDLPPDLAETGSHIIGFALGTCEEGNFAGEKGACIATDMVAGVVPPTDIVTDIRDTVLYCPAFIWNKVTKKKAPILDGLACGGSAAGTGITIGKYVTAVTGVGAIAGTVADGGSTALKTVLKVTKASLKSGADRMIRVFDKIQLFKFENARVFFKAGKDESTWSSVTKFTKTTSENSRYINKLTEYFSEDVLAATIKNVDDYEGMVKGTKKVLSKYKTLDEAAPGTDKLTKAKFIKNVGRYSDDITEKYTHVLYEPKQGIFLFRGKEVKNIPIKIVDGKEVTDWIALKNGLGEVNRAKKDLEFIKNLPEAEKATVAKLSLGHVMGSPNIFISTSKRPSVAIEDFAKDDGFVFIINPRAGNTLDVRETLSLQLEKGEIQQSNYDLVRGLIENEDEVVVVEKIDIEDFLGVVRVKAKKVVKGSFDKNLYYRSDTPNDIDIAIKETGA